MDGEPPEGELDYATGKRWCESILARAVTDGFPGVVLRPPAVLGANDHTSRIAGYLARIEDGGPLLVLAGLADASIGVAWSKDVGTACAYLSEGAGQSFAYNVGFAGLTLRSFLDECATALGVPTTNRGGRDRGRSRASRTRSLRLLPLRPGLGASRRVEGGAGSRGARLRTFVPTGRARRVRELGSHRTAAAPRLRAASRRGRARRTTQTLHRFVKSPVPGGHASGRTLRRYRGRSRPTHLPLGRGLEIDARAATSGVARSASCFSCSGSSCRRPPTSPRSSVATTFGTRSAHAASALTTARCGNRRRRAGFVRRERRDSNPRPPA